jgi:hypothetical protein
MDGGRSSPEAIRRVAGGPSVSERPPVARRAIVSDRGSGRGGDSRRLVFGTRLLPESDTAAHMNPVVARFARTTGYCTSRLRRPCAVSCASHIRAVSVTADRMSALPGNYCSVISTCAPASPALRMQAVSWLSICGSGPCEWSGIHPSRYLRMSFEKRLFGLF